MCRAFAKLGTASCTRPLIPSCQGDSIFKGLRKDTNLATAPWKFVSTLDVRGCFPISVGVCMFLESEFWYSLGSYIPRHGISMQISEVLQCGGACLEGSGVLSN